MNTKADLEKIQASKLLSSYAVPPTSSFTCPPCSIRIRNSSDAVTTRYTICAVKQSECQVECFKETIQHSKPSAVSTYHHVIEDPSLPVHIDFVPTNASSGKPEALPDVIIVHRDGTVRRISGDFQRTRWVSATVPNSDERALPPEVISAHWVSHADASAALLRRRADILKECNASDSSFLVLVYRYGDHQESGLRIGVFDVPMTLRTGFISASFGQRLRLLVCNPVPESRRWNLARDLRVDFHAPSARMCISSMNDLTAYDLSAYAPVISSKLALDDGHSSLFPLTGTLTAGALHSAVQIYDTNYQSIKARFELNTKPRRREVEDNARTNVHFISYFLRINTLLAVRGRSLLSFKMAKNRATRMNSSEAGSLLIDSLGQGTYASSRITAQAHAELRPGFSKALFVPNPLERAGWEERQKKLDDLVEQQQVDAFEHVMAMEFQDTATQEKNGIRHTDLKLPGDEQFVRYDMIHYLLSKVFRASATPTAVGEANSGVDLVVAFFPPRLLRWLARQNHLGKFKIERALSTERSQLQLKPGAVARSIKDQDPSLILLVDYLEGANLASLHEAVAVIKMLIKDAVALAQGEAESEQLLPEDTQKTALDKPIRSAEETHASESPSAGAAGGWSTGSVLAMNRTLERLYGFSPLKSTSAFRTYLDTEETLTLIQFLRQQLFRSGYTSSFPSIPVVAEGAVLSLKIIVSVLSNCIDALGPLGFLGSAFEQGLWQDLLPDLKGETSLALAGIEEATYLKGFLQEVVRYGSAAESKQVLSIGSPLKHLGQSDMGDGTITRIYAEPTAEQVYKIHEQSSLLPLSLDVENTVSKTKKRKGGGEVNQRSGREMQYLKHRNMGRYSFERLIL